MNSAAGGDLDLKKAAQTAKKRGSTSLLNLSTERGRAAPPTCRRQVELSEVDQRETSGLLAAGKFRGKGLPVLLSRKAETKKKIEIILFFLPADCPQPVNSEEGVFGTPVERG